MNKQTRLAVILVCLLSLTACEEKPVEAPKEPPKPPSLKEVANTIFQAVKEDDFGTVQAHYGNKEELKKLVGGLDDATDPEGKWAARRQSGLEQLITEPKGAWDKLRADAKVSQVDLAQIVLEDIRIERRKKGPIDTADMRLVVKSSKGFFRVKLDDWMKTDQGWRLFNELEWQRPPPEPAPFYPDTPRPPRRDKAQK